MGLNPYEFSENLSSQIDSNRTVRAFCIIFSLGFPTLSGLSSFLPGLGIITLLDGDNENLPDLIFRAISSNHSRLIPSSVSLVIPLDMFPGLLFCYRRNSRLASMLIIPLYLLFFPK